MATPTKEAIMQRLGVTLQHPDYGSSYLGSVTSVVGGTIDPSGEAAATRLRQWLTSKYGIEDLTVHHAAMAVLGGAASVRFELPHDGGSLIVHNLSE